MGAFATKAEGGAFAADRDEIRRALSLFLEAGERHVLHGLPSNRELIVSADDLDAAVEAAASLSNEQVYWSLNPLRPRCARRVESNILHRRWLLVDVDAIRSDPRESSSTDAEKSACGSSAVKIAEWLQDEGWPSPVLVDSGNGWHLLYRIDLPNTKLSTQVVKAVLHELASRFNGPSAKVDSAVCDAPRIARLPGTMSRKGPNSADRPHRMARIAWTPETIEVVSTEQLQHVGSPRSGAGPTDAAHIIPFATRATDSTGKAAYVKAAVDRECLRVATAPRGERNVALNRATFSLAQFSGWPEFDEDVVKAALRLVAERAGLNEQEVRATIDSGWKAGVEHPRSRERVAANGAHVLRNGVVDELAPHESLVVFGNKVAPVAVDWLWQDRIAVGFITLFAGRTGVGKSFALLDFIARMTRGGELPDGGRVRSGGALLISEDPHDYVLTPRLMELGADLSRVAYLKWEAMAHYSLADTSMLDRAYLDAGEPILVAIDPPANFLGGRTDEHKNSEVRQILMQVVTWLNLRNVACVMITHVNKQVGKGVEAVDRIMGSVAWASTCRIALGFAPDPDEPGRYLCAGIKNNLGPRADTFAYEIKKTDSLAKVEWFGKVDTTADEAMNREKRRPRRMTAIEFLANQFGIARSWKSEELFRLAKEAGISRSAMFEAKQDAPIRAVQVVSQDGDRYWEWQAHPGWPPAETDETLETLKSCPPKSFQDNTHPSVSMGGEERDSESESQSLRISEFHSFEGCGEGNGETVPRNPDVSGAKEEGRGDSARALSHLVGMLFDGPAERDRVVAVASERGIPFAELMRGVDRLGVVVTVQDDKMMWSMP